MIRIEKLTRGRWGNKILHYNTLLQLSKTYNREPSCGDWSTDNQYYWDGNQYFKEIVKFKLSMKPIKEIRWEDILKEDFNLDSICDYKLDDYSLHNVFFKVTKTDPREFLKLKDIYKPDLNKDYLHVGIHIRGGDIMGADGNFGREIHSPEYYINSIKLIEEEFKGKKIKYYVCTDDKNFDTYILVTNYLIDNDLDFEEGSDSIRNKTIKDSDKDFIYDFGLLSECDILINSSSTFCVCTGFLGKKNKKIIHSKEWLERNLQHTLWHKNGDPEHVRQWQLSFDQFWVDLFNGGNEYYKIWKII